MAYIIETPNPFEPMLNLRKHEHPGGISIRQWLEQTYPGFTEFDVPTICVVNGQALLRKEWDHVIKERDIVNIITCPGYLWIAVILVVILVAVTFALQSTVSQPKTPGEQPASDPVFTLKGQQNQVRMGEPIEACYGRNRIYPSLAMRPYYLYEDNNQFQYALFCIGHGEFSIDAVQIGDSPIADFAEAEYEIVEPGDSVTLFPTNVYTSSEAGGQTLFASNEPEIVGDGYVGPFTSNPPNTRTEKILIDVVFPKGIYSVNDAGELEERFVEIHVEGRPIDDAGAPLGPFTSFIDVTYSAATTTPQRRTIYMEVGTGRYEIKVRREDIKDLGIKAGHDAVWEGMRAFIDIEQDWGEVTLFAVRIRATNNLNDSSQRQFNVVATRKLPIRDEDGVWSAPTATRGIVWALVDVFKSVYGGRVFDDGFFDWDVLLQLDSEYEARNEHFDWVFRDPIVVWDAAKAIASVGRAVPLLVGSLITLKRDELQDIPVTMFTPDNMVKDTFSWDLKLWDLDEFDSVQIEYTEPLTGYKQETVIATLPGGTTDHPKEVRLAGCQNREHAYREALFLAAVDRYLRENISFETGMEGFIPSYGDLIAIAHDVPRWGQSGYVVKAERGAGYDWNLWVSEPLIFGDSGEHQIFLRDKDSTLIGPLTAHQTEDSQQILVNVEESDFDFLEGGRNEPMLFLFGVSGQITKYAKIVRIEPQGGERIRITAVEDQPTIYSFDELTAPALSLPPYPPQPLDLPEIANIYISQVDSILQIVQVSWTAALGAQYYVVETSTDGDNWTENFTTTRTSIQLQVRSGALFVRVAAVNLGQGPWIEDSISVTSVTGLVNDVPWDDLEWGVRWSEVLNVVNYNVKIYNSEESGMDLKSDTLQSGRSFVYNYDDAVGDSNITRNMTVEVIPVFADESEGTPAQLDLTNSIPTAPQNPGSEISSEESDQVVYRLFWDAPTEEDLIRVVVWVSDVSGFDPEVDVPVIDEYISAPGAAGMPVEAFVNIALESDGGHPTQYWRVGFFDVWGNEIATNLTPEQTIAAYP